MEDNLDYPFPGLSEVLNAYESYDQVMRFTSRLDCIIDTIGNMNIFCHNMWKDPF